MAFSRPVSTRVYYRAKQFGGTPNNSPNCVINSSILCSNFVLWAIKRGHKANYLENVSQVAVRSTRRNGAVTKLYFIFRATVLGHFTTLSVASDGRMTNELGRKQGI